MIRLNGLSSIVTFLTMIISAIREIVNPKVTQIAECGSLASTVIDSPRRLRVFLDDRSPVGSF